MRIGTRKREVHHHNCIFHTSEKGSTKNLRCLLAESMNIVKDIDGHNGI